MKIVFLDHKALDTVEAFEKLTELGEFTSYETTLTEETVERCKGKDVIITNKVLLTKEILEQLPDLKLICVSATGTNNVDIEYATEMGLVVKNVTGYSTNSVAQHTFAMLLSLTNNICFYDNFVKEGHYAASNFFMDISKTVYELKDKVFGIIGLGAIGKRVAAIAEAFGANVVYYSTSGKNYSSKYQRLELNDLLKISDVVSIHSPLNENTKNLIDKDTLKLMKQTAFLINTGRGDIVCEESLARAIDMEMIGGAAIDVYTNEPVLPDSPLLKIVNKEKIIFTPHNAWASVEARNILVERLIENIQSFF